MSKRNGVGKVFGRAAAGPLNLSILGGAVLGAVALASWPIAALGGAAYAALVASDVSSAEFRKRVLFGRTRPTGLPDPKTLSDPEVRAAVERVRAARANLDQVVKTIPARIQRNVLAALSAIDELQGHGAALAIRADELARYLAGTDAVAAQREAESLAARASHTPDAAARASYEAAAQAATERVTALQDITTARERALAHLARIESAIKSVPAKLVRLRALDDQASDALTGDVGAELERMNIDLRAFEQTLESIVEVTPVKPKSAIVIAFLVAVAAILYFAIAKRGGDAPVRPVVGPASGAPVAAPADAVELTFEYSTEKKDWLEAAIAEFQRANPQIRVKLVGKGSLDAANAILDGTDKPILWSPADSLVANLLASDWQTKNQRALFATTGDGAPQPLLLTPMVFVVWEERAKVLEPSASGQLSWKTIHDAVASPKGWAGLGGKPAWGFVTLGHTDPNKSNSGLQSVALMAYEYFNTTSGLTVEQLLDPKFQAFVKTIERGVQHFEASTGTFMTDMIRFGPSKYDIAVVYESLAIAQLENAQGRWGSLHIYYPPVTIWSDHPVVVLDAPWVTPAQKQAAATLISYLRSTPVQATALRFGFRPADTSVPIKTSDAANPFTKSAQYGLSLELPPAAQPPDGPVIRNLLMMWSRVVAK